jgi:glycosyltransferase involved in cell wall biosynthesis
MPGFLPPAREELEPTLIDPGTSEFLARHRPIVAANGKVAWHQGEDLYGLDMLVGILEGLSAEYPELGVVVCLSPPARREREYLDALRARAMARGCGERFWVRTTDGFFLPILVRASLFVRPTNTEGDSNSVREALSLGIPTVASDVAPRPPGSVLFRNRDQADLNEKVRRLLSGAGCVDPAADQEKDRTRAGVDQYLEFLLGRPLARSLAEAVDS